MPELQRKFIIDCQTAGKKNLMRRLNALKSIKSATDGGAYRQDLTLSQVHVTTTWTEEELESWLYTTKGIDYLGVVEREEESTEEDTEKQA